VNLLEDRHIVIQICRTEKDKYEEAAKKRGAACGARNSGKQLKEKLWAAA
jgi:hypothetical protein